MGNRGFDGHNLIIVIASLLILVFILSNFNGKKPGAEEPEFDVITISVGQPELDIEPAKFYLVENQWGYGLVQLKDTELDKKLDKIFCNTSNPLFAPQKFHPETGYPSDRAFDPNETWNKRFEKVLQEHRKKLEFQQAHQPRPIK